MNVYLALYNPMTEESVAKTISIHKTRKGAEMAIEFHKHEIQDNFKELYQISSLEYSSDGMIIKWDDWQWWGIKETTILD